MHYLCVLLILPRVRSTLLTLVLITAKSGNVKHSMDRNDKRLMYGFMEVYYTASEGKLFEV